MNYIQVVDEIFHQFQGKKFSIKLWDGKTRSYGSGKTSLFTLIIKDPFTVQRLLSQGSLGFGESYMDGSLRIDGDIDEYLRLRHQFKKVRPSLRLAVATFLAQRTIPQDRQTQIAQHYDLGNDFFQLFLDANTMSYSSARYETGHETLDDAQEKKLHLLSSWIDLPKGAAVLDLGSGWGGFAKYASSRFGWHVTGFTLSKAQLGYCKKNIEDSKDSHTSFLYRDMTQLPAKKYTAVVVLESIEHVGQEHLTQFVQSVARVLKPGGSLIIQTTGRYQPKRVDRWTLKYIFPGGYLPTKDELISAGHNAGLNLERFRDNTDDYIHTITEWITNFEKNRKVIEKMHGESFYRMWELYLHGAKVNFEIGDMSLFRFHFRKPK